MSASTETQRSPLKDFQLNYQTGPGQDGMDRYGGSDLGEHPSEQMEGGFREQKVKLPSGHGMTWK